MFEQHLKHNCRFAQWYFLPCCHIFHLDVEDKVLTPPVWKSYVDLFEEGGFKVYETIGWVDVDERLAVQESIKTRSVLGLREIEERLRQQLRARLTISEVDQFEDLTGAIPLLMDRSTVNGNIDLDSVALKNVANEVTKFSGRVKKDPDNWKQ